MNRTIFLILAFLLLALTPQATAPRPAETPRPTEIPGPTDVPGAYGVALPKGLLPDTGYEVITPPARYYDNTTLGLIPADNYGRIWPYIGGWLNWQWNRGIGYPCELIGICDSDGKIICDPYYNRVELIEQGGVKLYAFIKYNMEPGVWRAKYITTVAALDGSWTATYDALKWEEDWPQELGTALDDYGTSRGYRWRGLARYDYMTAQMDGKWGVLDWDGTVLLPPQYNEPVCFSEGLAAILSDDGATVSFIDITGETVLGPYEAPPRQVEEYNFSGVSIPITDDLLFIEGHARFYKNGKYGMIDRDGNIKVPAEYDYITSFSGGIAKLVLSAPPDDEAPHYRELSGLVNDAGEVIFEPEDCWLDNENGNAVLRDRNGDGVNIITYDGRRHSYGRTSVYTPPDIREYLYDMYETVIPIDGRYLVRGEHVAGLLDGNGDFVIKVPITVFSSD